MGDLIVLVRDGFTVSDEDGCYITVKKLIRAITGRTSPIVIDASFDETIEPVWKCLKLINDI